MPYGDDDHSQMSSFLGGLRHAFGGDQSQGASQDDDEEERRRQLRLAALRKMVSSNAPIINEAAAEQVRKSFK